MPIYTIIIYFNNIEFIEILIQDA